MEAVDGIEAIDGLLHEVLARPPVDRQAAEPSHQPSERPAEQLSLAEPGRPDAEHVRDRQHERQVPVRGVRCGDHDRLGSVGEAALDAPAREPEIESTQPTGEPAHSARRRHRRS